MGATKTFDIKYADGRHERFDVTRAWGTLFDPTGHHHIRDEIRRRFPEWDQVVVTDSPTHYYHVTDNYNGPGCRVIARVHVNDADA